MSVTAAESDSFGTQPNAHIHVSQVSDICPHAHVR